MWGPFDLKYKCPEHHVKANQNDNANLRKESRTNPEKICGLGRGLKTKSWNIKTKLAELGVFMHKFAIENDPKP